MTQAASTQPNSSADKNAVRPFRVNVPESELIDLRKRIIATKWPERETVNDATQGVQLATIEALASYPDRIDVRSRGLGEASPMAIWSAHLRLSWHAGRALPRERGAHTRG